MITNWTYIIPGYTQTAGTRTRLIDLWERLHAESVPETDAVLLRPWCSDWESEAELAFRLNGAKHSIRICGYSWGAGWGAIRLCEEFKRRGLTVEKLTLIDPVHRHPNPLRRWRSLFPSMVPIRLPANVGQVSVFAQHLNWPRAHRVLRGVVEISPHVVLCTHDNMDDAPEVIDECYQFLRKSDG